MVVNEGRNIGLTLQLITNDLLPDTGATVTVKILDSTGTEAVSARSVTYSSVTQSYIISVSPSADWVDQEVGSYFVVWSISDTSDDFPSVATEDLQIAVDDTKVDRILGLVQENHYIDQASYDSLGCMTSARIRTYTDSASVGTNNNVLATYSMTAEYDVQGRMTDYKVSKI